jgi:cytidylate kinase
MLETVSYERCLSFIKSQSRPVGREAAGGEPAGLGVTISRMAGSGGYRVASKLAQYLQSHIPGRCEWTVFDRNLIQKVLEDHHLSKRIAGFMMEEHKSAIMDSVEEYLGLHPSSWTLVQKTAQTILRLAQTGRVIIMGRGGNVITADLPNVFHVRLVGSLEKRIKRVQEEYNLDRQEALDLVNREDKGRSRYLRENFDKDIDDPLLYHLIVNTDLIECGEAACLVGDEVIRRFQLQSRLRAAGK